MLVAGRDRLLVAARPSGLDDSGDARLRRRLHRVRVGEVSIGGQHRSLRGSPAFFTASSAASTRLVTPPPIPTALEPWAMTMALDLVCLQTTQAKRSAARSSGVGARLVTPRISSGSPGVSRVCTIRPPVTCLKAHGSVALRLGSSNRRRSFLTDRAAAASWW